jgi:hypothetical protein
MGNAGDVGVGPGNSVHPGAPVTVSTPFLFCSDAGGLPVSMSAWWPTPAHSTHPAFRRGFARGSRTSTSGPSPRHARWRLA